MRLLRRSDYKRVPWKNGGGETAEIAVFPPASSTDRFDWRISMATIAADGPFSVFEGVDRTLSVLSGEGIVLSLEDAADVQLAPSDGPYAFAGETAASCRLLGGPTHDLNVMTRRSRLGHRVERIAVSRPETICANETLTFIFSACRQTLSTTAGALALFDSVILEPGENFTWEPLPAGEVFRIDITKGSES